jgi:hypothetical protein
MTALGIGCLGLSLVSPVFAEEMPQGVRQEMRQEIREEVRENLRTGTGPGALKQAIGMRAIVTKGTVTSKSTSNIVISDTNGKIYTVTFDTKTQFHRKFWGKGSFDEIQVGHTVSVVGKWLDESKTQMLALQIRDASIQKRNGVFFGDVSSVTSTGFVLATKARGNQTVIFTNTPKVTNRNGIAITSADILVGHRVRVIGLWDTASNSVTEVTQVRDFDLSVKSVLPTFTPSPKP